jgi:uncharacterized protein with FMN-binding domain
MVRAILLSLLVFVSSAAPLLAVDVVELLSGAKVQGEITGRTASTITMKVTLSGVVLNRSYAVTSVHAITTADGTRTVINEKGAAPQATPKASATPNASGSPKATGNTRPVPAAGGGTRAQLDKLIDEVGRTPPDWFEDAKLNYPPSLDLTWPQQPPGGGWNNQKNVGQFIWDIINPNPNRWQEGVKLMHHLLTMHKDDKEKTEKIMLGLANMYHNLHEDYARAAFWYRAAGVERNPGNYLRQSPALAECYWRLGYRSEALALISKAPITFPLAKLLADMGETDRALQICSSGVKTSPAEAYLYAGDACRVAGRYSQALAHYQKLVDLPPPANNPNRHKQYRDRAVANVAAIKAFELFDLSKIADGSYQSESQGYEGPVQVSVTVAGNKITDVKVTNHKEKQFYSAIADTPRKIIAKQSVRGVDTTSHATITSEAIVNATAKALAGNGN